MKKTLYFFLLIQFLSSVTAANVPAPFFGGGAGFEPFGLENFDSVAEKVGIDLLNLESYTGYRQDNKVKLENSFEIENGQSEKIIEIVLPLSREYKIFLDNIELSVNAAQKSNEPSKWKIPNQTNWTEGKKIAYTANFSPPQIVQIKIPGGKHTLKIRQELTPSNNVSGILTKYWQFSFVFLPPENRKNVTKTEIEIKTPPNWQSVISPNLNGANGVWQGSLDNSATNSITVTTKMPAPESYRKIKDLSEYFVIFMLFGFPLIGLILCALFFSKSKIWWLWGIIFTLLWSALTLCAVYVSEFVPEWTIPESQQLNYGYEGIGSIFFMLICGVATFVAGFPLWLTVWGIAKYVRTNKP